MSNLVWLNNDLRLHDNPALYYAANKNVGVIAVYFYAPNLWKQQGLGKERIAFQLQSLLELESELKHKNIPLLIIKASDSNEISIEINRLCEGYKVKGFYYNKLFCPILRKYERQILENLNESDVETHAFDAATILPAGRVLTKQQKFYTVFTPFYKRWLEVYQDAAPKVLTSPKKQKVLVCKSDIAAIPENLINKSQKVGEKVAQARLKSFVKQNIKAYKDQRDYPAIDGTSKLSVFLATGTISTRLCVQQAMQANAGKLIGGDEQIETWIKELVWRDFYKHLLTGFPFLYENQAFRNKNDRIPWNNSKKLLPAWQQGRTGYPIVDAAMRQLNATGWMHNRLRMITAMFLTKLLQIDWRQGEQYFAEKLLDYDFAANNGGWQWCASTGADAVPYFRIFNPELQQQKYDPDFVFIKKFCPEAITGKSYPDPIVEYKKAKSKYLRLVNLLK